MPCGKGAELIRLRLGSGLRRNPARARRASLNLTQRANPFSFLPDPERPPVRHLSSSVRLSGAQRRALALFAEPAQRFEVEKDCNPPC